MAHETYGCKVCGHGASPSDADTASWHREMRRARARLHEVGLHTGETIPVPRGLVELGASVGITDHTMLQRAVTHKSCATAAHNHDHHGLEIIGDALWGVAIARRAVELGETREIQSRFVDAMRNQHFQVDVVRTLGLDKYARFADSIRNPDKKKKLLSNLLEAFIGAAGTVEAAERVLDIHIQRHGPPEPTVDYHDVLCAEWKRRGQTYRIECKEQPFEEKGETTRVWVAYVVHQVEDDGALAWKPVPELPRSRASELREARRRCAKAVLATMFPEKVLPYAHHSHAQRAAEAAERAAAEAAERAERAKVEAAERAERAARAALRETAGADAAKPHTGNAFGMFGSR